MSNNRIIPAFPQSWIRKFAHLGIIGGRSILAPMDGDIALLHELRDRCIAANPMRLSNLPLPEDFLWRQVVDTTWINPDTIRWDDDDAAELLAQWRAAS